MAELESVIEKRLIDQLCCDESQWTYRPDIRTEEQLWNNFKYILEQNNKAKLSDIPLSDSEFAKIKNDLSHASFFGAGKWLAGENGKVYVHIQRGNEMLHLMVMNNEHIAGGSSVYEVINQYQAFKSEDSEGGRDRRFDVTLLINGVPLIHIELKNKEHSYMDGFRQIKKYIAEGKFRGIFSNVQMFVVSNAVDTKYFSAARDTELNKKFITGWLDKENQPVCDYIEFAKAVLKIPEAHEMVAKYTVLDKDKEKLLILRPYQIHAIEAMRAASKQGRSGFIWHTTGSGKTMTSYKAARNLLMDIPAIEKTVFLIDRKDLDMQTKMAFQSYADNDTIDVDDTDNVDALIKKMSDGNRQMIVTTRQKMQIMVNRRLKEGTSQYNKIKSLKVAFVVDECHRAVTPKTKRELERFFVNSLWYGFTGTPIFDENKYEQKGDLPQTTEQLYGECLHSYTIKEAIHDEAVLGFMVENLGAKDLNADDNQKVYETKAHMRKVLNVILNQSYEKFGMKNGRGRTYEAVLTTSSIAMAQKYYDLLKKVKEGGDELKINEDIRKALPDFPKFAITYSLSENEEASAVNQDKMKEALEDYNEMFGSSYKIDVINAYNSNLNDRLARKEKKYLERSQQLDLVIVVDRLLTGFDAPCLSILFMDRKPMTPQNIIQAFSRTNRLFDANKQYGQIVTFQYPKEYKEAINKALRLYSRGGSGDPIAEDWDDVKRSFSVSLKAIRDLAQTPEDIAGLSRKQKKAFINLCRALDHDFAHLKSFSVYEPHMLDEFGFSESEYENYAAMYKNVMEEFKNENDNPDPDEEPVRDDYDLVAYSRLRIDFEYIVELLQGFVESLDQSENDFNETEFETRITGIKEVISEFAEDNPQLSALLGQVVDDIVQDKTKFLGRDISAVINDMRYSIINDKIREYAEKWYLEEEDVRYEVFNSRDGKLANENKLKDSADYTTYKRENENAVSKFKFRKNMSEEFNDKFMPEIKPLV
ncbi:MAG: type I restriction endonuclease subunit R [Firmicutes bacterium]|nr:type I restriction endonuclease subunit R [Bacillota bacterium]